MQPRSTAGRPTIGLKALLITIWTAGCATQPTVIDSFCLSYEPVYLAGAERAALSRATKERLAANNRRYEAQCD